MTSHVPFEGAMGSQSMSDSMRCHVDMSSHGSVINIEQLQHLATYDNTPYTSKA